MATNDDNLQLRLVTKELEACLKRNCLLQTENDRLKQEVTSLQTGIHYLKEQHRDRSLSFLNNLKTSTESISPNKHTTHVKSHRGMEVKNGEMRDKEKTNQLPKPTPKATCLDLPQEVNEKKLPVRTAAVPPSPPPFPSKLLLGSPNAVRRVPEVMEIYRTLTRRETKTDNKITNSGTSVANTRDMIGEIENRSTYLLAIKSDVEAHGDFIRFLTKEVENAAYKDISNVEAFVKWLDGELSYLVDERAVLKHFPQWPERKADALREAAFNYRDLKNLESEVLSFGDNPKQPILLPQENAGDSRQIRKERP